MARSRARWTAGRFRDAIQKRTIGSTTQADQTTTITKVAATLFPGTQPVRDRERAQCQEAEADSSLNDLERCAHHPNFTPTSSERATLLRGVDHDHAAITFRVSSGASAERYHRAGPAGLEEVHWVDDALRIALVAPAWYPLPPRGYGGTELGVHLLHNELRRLGHEVTGFGAEGSESGVTMVADAAWSHDLGGPAEAARHATSLARAHAAVSGRPVAATPHP